MVLLLLPASAVAQVSLGGEQEAGLTGGNAFDSQYLFFDSDRSHALIRWFWVEGKLTRAELGVGPTIKRGRLMAKPTVGATTDRELMASIAIESKFGLHRIVYIADAKFAQAATTSSLYQKVWLGLDRGNVWQIRCEQSISGRKITFIRVGLEYQFQLPTKTPTHFYVVPFYDVKSKQWGTLGGFRFFGRKIG